MLFRAIPMTKVEDYRTSAADALRLAQSASSSEDKGRLLAIAGAWLDLADRLSRRGSFGDGAAHLGMTNRVT